MSDEEIEVELELLPVPAEPVEQEEAETVAEPAPVPAPPVGKGQGKGKRLNGAQWAQVVVLWELGKATVMELAGMFGISEQGIRAGLTSRGAKKGIRAHEVGEQIVEAQKSQAAQQIEKISAMREKYLSYNDLITKLTLKEITEAARDKVPLASRKDNLTALQKAAAIIARNRHENYHLLGLYNQDTQDEELPDIGITEYSPEELEQIQRGFEPATDEVDQFAEPDVALPFDDDEIIS